MIKSAFTENEGGNVAVAVRDLRWLLCLVDRLRESVAMSQTTAYYRPEGRTMNESSNSGAVSPDAKGRT